MLFIKKNISLTVLVTISASLIFFNVFCFPNNILCWDVFGYYMYLPMTFIYNNWGLQNIDILHTIIEKYHNTSSLYQAYQTDTGFWVMRYSMGMAFLYAPFFFIGHFICGYTSFPQDGYSLPYQAAILAGGIIYSIVGFLFLRKTLLKYFTDGVAGMTLIIIYFGTNYFMHTTFHGQNALSHNYLFTLYTLIIWLTIKWHETFRTKYAMMLGLFCGLSIIARPSEVVCLLIPVLWGLGSNYSFVEKTKLLWKMKNHILIFFGIILIIAMPQFIYWKLISGKFLFNSYGDNPGEGFEFLHPYLTEVLFSFRKGWFIYTPMAIFMIAGIYISLKKKKEFSYPFFAYFIANLYIVASWSCWWYAESFGQRALIPSYAVLALPLGMTVSYIFNSSRTWIVNTVLAFISLLILLNIFQTWQITQGIIHGSRMTKEAYYAVFGKTKSVNNIEKLLMIDRWNSGPIEINELEYSKTKQWIEDFEKLPNAVQEQSFSKTHSFRLDSSIIYSVPIEKRYDEISDKDHTKLKIRMQIYCTMDPKNNPGSLVASFEHKGYSYGYSTIDIEKLNIGLNKWTEISLNYLTPVIRVPSDKLKVYYWHRGKNQVFIDDLKVEVWEKKF